MSERILVASDGGPGADGAVRLADALAREKGAAPEVIAVAEPFELYALAGVPDRPEGYAVIDEVRAANLLASVGWQLENGLGGGREWPVLVEMGEPASVIARSARDRGASLLLVGRSTHTPLEVRPGDETALRVTTLSPAPVLLVDPEASALPRHVLAAIDFGEPARWAARAALRLLGERATVFLAHVVPERAELDPLPSLREWREGYERAVAERLAEISAELRGASEVETECIVASGEPAHELLVLADRLNVELITAGVRRHEGDRVEMPGRIASALLRGPRHSVLVHPASPGRR